jgi:hypothetical protein
MFTSNKLLQGLVVRATDGEIGTVEHLYFDDVGWAVRYLTVETGNWLGGRAILISPHSILQVDWKTGRIDVALTRKQIENGPSIDTHRPVSRQHEEAYYSYYGYPNYWDGPYLWGPSYYPGGVMGPARLVNSAPAATDDIHLRSTEAVTGYHVEATDGEIGHIDHFIVDDEAWAIRYLAVATKNWWPGKKVLLSPSWVERMSWEESKIFVATTREVIQTCPEYVDTASVTRKYEHQLYLHYGRPPYWTEESRRTASFAHSTA